MQRGVGRAVNAPQAAFDPALRSAAAAVAMILRSETLNEAWGRHYATHKDENPAHAIADRLNADPETIRTDPVIYRLSSEVISVIQHALGQPATHRSAETNRPQSGLEATTRYLENIRPEGKIFPKKRHLPEEQQRLLKLLDYETGRRFTPLSSGGDFTRRMWTHIWEDMKKNPKAFGGMMSVSLGALAFMQMKLGSSSTIYIDPNLLAIRDLSFDSLEPGQKLETDPTLLIGGNLAGSCHDHAQQLFGAQFASYLPSFLSNMHCGKYMVMAQEAQSRLQSGYDWMTQRLAVFTGDRAMEVANALPDCSFVEGFKWGAAHAANFFYKADFVENGAVHPLIFLVAFLLAHKTLTLDSEEAREQKEKITDFFNRAVHVKPLNHIFSLAAGGAAYVMGDGLNTNMIWAAAGGATLGACGHKLVNFLQRKTKALKLCEPAQARLEELKIIADLQHSQTDITPTNVSSPGWARRAFSFAARHKKLGVAFAAAACLAGLVGADMNGALNAISDPIIRDALIASSRAMGAATGIISVGGAYGAVNIPQDVGLHTIFIAMGGSLGIISGLAQRGSRYAVGLVRKRTSENLPRLDA